MTHPYTVWPIKKSPLFPPLLQKTEYEYEYFVCPRINNINKIIVYQSFFSIETIANPPINKQIAQIVPIQSSLCLVFWGFVYIEFLQSYHMMNNNPCLLLSFPIPLKGNFEWLWNYTLFVYIKNLVKVKLLQKYFRCKF